VAFLLVAFRSSRLTARSAVSAAWIGRRPYTPGSAVREGRFSTEKVNPAESPRRSWNVPPARQSGCIVGARWRRRALPGGNLARGYSVRFVAAPAHAGQGRCVVGELFGRVIPNPIRGSISPLRTWASCMEFRLGRVFLGMFRNRQHSGFVGGRFSLEAGVTLTRVMVLLAPCSPCAWASAARSDLLRRVGSWQWRLSA